MSEIKRYELDWSGPSDKPTMRRDSLGEYVRFDDYAAVLADLHAAEARFNMARIERDTLEKKVSYIKRYWDAFSQLSADDNHSEEELALELCLVQVFNRPETIPRPPAEKLPGCKDIIGLYSDQGLAEKKERHFRLREFRGERR